MKLKAQDTILPSIFLFFIIINSIILLNFNISAIPFIATSVIVSALFGFLLIVTANPILTTVFSSLLILFTLFADEIVYHARLVHIRFADFFAIRQAMRVADKYTFHISFNFLRTAAIILLLDFVIIYFAKKHKSSKSRIISRCSGIVLFVLSTIFFFSSTIFTSPNNPEWFDTNSFIEKNGLFYSWYCQYKNSSLTEPDDYSEEKAVSLLKNYTSNGETEKSDDNINIIVIMNEAFSDYSLIGETSFKDPLPNIHNKENGYVEGKLAVSVFGGYTANTEYEFLTGNSLAFLPEGVFPFLQYMNAPVSSLISEVKDEQFSATTIHPYYSEEWNRVNAYKQLGVDSFIPGEKFSDSIIRKDDITNITGEQLAKLNFGDDLEYLRGFISDRECYSKVYNILSDNYSNNDKSFIFAITVQNHGGYDYNENDFLSDFYTGISDLDQYLTCLSYSDTAFKEFTDQLKDFPEKTVVLMFGDHQPGLDFSPYVSNYGELIGNKNNPNKFIVPYIFWANFDTEFDMPAYISINYLSALLKSVSGLSLTPWDNFRMDVLKEYPVITDIRIEDSFGNQVIEFSEKEKLKNYNLLQYYYMSQ